MKTANGLWFRKNQHIWIQTVATGKKVKWHRGKLKKRFPGLHESLERVAKANKTRHVLVEGDEFDPVMGIKPYDCSYHEPEVVSPTGRRPQGPEWQRLPPRTEEGKKIRDAFTKNSTTIVEADYQQLELSIFAAAMTKETA